MADTLTSNQKQLLLSAVGDPATRDQIVSELEDVPDGNLATSYLKADGSRELSAAWETGSYGINIGTVAVPTISSTSTLTNKSISGLTNTITNIGSSEIIPAMLQKLLVTVTSAQILAMFTTPKVLLAAPGAGLVHIVESIYVTKAAGTAYAVDAAGFSVRYTNGSGADIGCTITEAIAETAGATITSIKAATTLLTPVDGAAVVLYADNANPTTGDTAMKVLVFYRTVSNPAT